MSRRAAKQKSHGAPGRPTAPARPAVPPAAPPPPTWRDPWAWAAALSPIALVLKSLGAPLGEPVAEDIDFLHRAFLEPGGRTLLDGGGSTAFWRPIPHQLYYQILGPTILHHPLWIAALHTGLLGMASVLLYRAFRSAWPAPWSALIATFPLFSESTRTLISWPTHFVDLGLWLFVAVALHETAARRLWSALVALLAALLCKEVAVVAALLLPWLLLEGPRGRGERLRWMVAMGAVTALWGAAYLAIRQRNGLALPHHLENDAATHGISWITRMGWSLVNSLRALFSLPAVRIPGEWAISAAGGALLVVALGAVALWRRPRDLLARSFALPLWGLAWFLAASGTLMVIFPMWMPNRSGFGSLGFAALAAGLLGAAHPALLAFLFGMRLVTFALGPAPPVSITPLAPETGAFMDFQHLVRLQRLMRETRTTLGARYPTMPPGGIVGQHYLPRHAEYAYGGDKALQVWYADTTLRWVTYAEFRRHPELPLTTLIEFQSTGSPQLALVETEAMRSLLHGVELLTARDWNGSLAACARADSIQRDTSARVFLGSVDGQRSVALMALGHGDEAVAMARRGLDRWHENTSAFYVIATYEFEQGRARSAMAYVDSVLKFIPDHEGALRLRQLIQKSRAQR